MKHGLVLEGGAMRGLFTAGVMDVMMEEGIAFDGAVGVSAGAVFGCNFKSHQPGRVLRYNCASARTPATAASAPWCAPVWGRLLLPGDPRPPGPL